MPFYGRGSAARQLCLTFRCYRLVGRVAARPWTVGRSPVRTSAEELDLQIRQLRVLVIDDSAFMRKIARGLLSTIGIKEIAEASDGIEGLEVIRAGRPDIVILDWEMPLLNGPDLVRIIRSPGVFPVPDIPIIMLTSHGDRWRVLEAARIGVNEFICKPVSAKVLRDRFISILLKPRASVQIGDYYGPAPRAGLAKAVSSE